MNLLVNATAANHGGLLTIVEQFLEEISNNDLNSNNKIYIFVSFKSLERFEEGNIKIINVNKKKWIKRYLWDTHGIKKWATINNINIDLFISLQNTPVNLKPEIKQVIYLHTPIPFVNYSWNLLKKNERKLWFYKHIYPFFIKRYINSNSHIIVQANWLKNEVLNSIPLLEESKVSVIQPDVKLQEKNIKEKSLKEENSIKLFYPAFDYVYKNHITLIKTIAQIKKHNFSIYKKINVVFTLERSSSIFQDVLKYDVEEAFSFVGSLNQEEMDYNYHSADAILFPSYIETFGLPLIEAASRGKYILIADEVYPREVLNNYSNLDYIDTFNEKAWTDKILNLNKESRNNDNFSFNSIGGWDVFFDLIKEKLKDDKTK